MGTDGGITGMTLELEITAFYHSKYSSILRAATQLRPVVAARDHRRRTESLTESLAESCKESRAKYVDA